MKKISNIQELIEEINKMRKNYNETIGLFYNFNQRFKEIEDEIEAIIMYLKKKEEERT